MAPPPPRPRWALAAMGALAVVAAATLWGALRPDAGPVFIAATPSTSAVPKVAERQPQEPPAAAARDTRAPLASMSQEAGIVAPGANDVRTGKPAGTASTPQVKVAGPATRNRASGPQAKSQVLAQVSEVQEHGIGGLVPPSVTCKDKVFLAKQFCVHTECQKPAFQNFPSCVRLREEASLREASKYGN